MSQPLLVLRAPSSHLYPGSRLRLTLGGDTGALTRCAERGADALLLFADGTQAAAQLRQDPAGELALQVDAYTTARGTPIVARAWRVSSMADSGAGFELRLGSRLAQSG